MGLTGPFANEGGYPVAKKTISSRSKQNPKKLRGPAWSELKPDTKRKYKAAGVTPAKFNAWRDPAVRAKAKKAGVERWQYLGLASKHKISGADMLAKAYANFERTFGSRPKFRPAGVREYLAGLREDEGNERIKELAQASSAELWDGTYPNTSKESSHHYH